MQRLGWGLFILLAAALILLFLLPSRIDPAGFRPPAAPGLEGPLAPNRALQSVELLGRGRACGPPRSGPQPQDRASVEERDGVLLLGSTEADAIGRYRLAP